MEFKNDFSSNISGLKNSPWKKEIIIGIICALMVISLIIVIIIVAVSSSSSKNSEKKDEIGMINCIYDIQTTALSTFILGMNFIKESEFDIYIDGEKIKFSKSYLFEKSKTYNIQFKLYESINMDYMFQNISSLISVEIISEKYAKIKSMINTFENCTNLQSFKINGFNTDEIKSIQKLFYNNIQITNID